MILVKKNKEEILMIPDIVAGKPSLALLMR